MIYVVSTLEVFQAVGIDTTHLRKSTDGKLAIIHREFLDPLVQSLQQHPETVIYEYQSKELDNLLSSPAWTKQETPDISMVPEVHTAFVRSMAEGVQHAAEADQQSESPVIPDKDLDACKELLREPWTDQGYATEDVGHVVIYNGQLYRILQAVPAGLQTPDTVGMWPYYQLIQPEYTGTEDDPIPLIITGSGTVLEQGLYYSYGGEVYKALINEYLCIYDPETVIGTVFQKVT